VESSPSSHTRPSGAVGASQYPHNGTMIKRQRTTSDYNVQIPDFERSQGQSSYAIHNPNAAGASYPSYNPYDGQGQFYQQNEYMGVQGQYQTPHQVLADPFANVVRQEGHGQAAAPVSAYVAPVRSHSFDQGTYNSAYPTPTSNGHHAIPQSLSNSASHEQLHHSQLPASQMYLPSDKIGGPHSHSEQHYDDLFPAPSILGSTGDRPASNAPSIHTTIAAPLPANYAPYSNPHEAYGGLPYADSGGLPPTCTETAESLTSSTLNSAYPGQYGTPYAAAEAQHTPLSAASGPTSQQSVPGYYPHTIGNS
jgi:hypothetical protein